MEMGQGSAIKAMSCFFLAVLLASSDALSSFTRLCRRCPEGQRRQRPPLVPRAVPPRWPRVPRVFRSVRCASLPPFPRRTADRGSCRPCATHTVRQPWRQPAS